MYCTVKFCTVLYYRRWTVLNCVGCILLRYTTIGCIVANLGGSRHVNCVLYTVYYVLYTVYCKLYMVYCILYTVYCILYTVCCLLHSDDIQ